MTNPPHPTTSRLWTPAAGFIEDEWRHGESLEGGVGNAGVILPLAAFLSLDAEVRLASAARVAVKLEPGDGLEAIASYLPSLPMVVMTFPAFSDGRSYSKAALLRARHGYGRPIRAAGQVLIDQIPLMIRAGFDAFEVSHPIALERLAEGRASGLPLFYQPAPSGDAPASEAYSWRRRAVPATRPD